MSALLGHEPQRRRLAEDLSPPAVLFGPSGVGKWLVAEEAAAAAGGAVRRVRGSASMSDVRDVIRWLDTHPIGGGTKIALVDLEVVGEGAQHALLKTLEEVPGYARVLLVTSRRVLPTIRSRCRVVAFGPLGVVEVATILEGLGHGSFVAAEAAKVSGGSVERALSRLGMADSRGLVLTLIDAVARRDRGALWGAMVKWDAEHSELLRTWLLEAVSGRFRVFSSSEMAAADRIGGRGVRMMLRNLMVGMDVDAAVLTDVW